MLVNLSFLSNKPTGITTYALNIIANLQSLKLTLLTPQSIPDYKYYEISSKLTSDYGTKGHFNRLLWTQFQLPQIYKNFKSSLLFSPLPEAPLYSSCRFVVTSFDMIPLRFAKRFSPLTAYHRYYTPQVLKQAQHIICISQTTAKDITDFYEIPASKITAIPLAHDRTHFLPLNLPTSNYFLYIGRQDPYKNIQRLISAFAALSNCKDYELWLVGPIDSRYTPTLKVQVAELGVTNQVKFLDYVPYSELPKIINQAIALVFPSLWEGFGLPVLEAMACGTPVITSNLSSLPEVAGDAAILINPYNTGEITEAMQSIANDSELRSHLSSQSITHSQQFSWEKTGKATAEVLSRYI